MTRASARMSAARPGTRLSRGGWASDVRRLAFGVRRPASGVRRLAFGVWRLAFGVWRLAFGIRILHLASCFLLLASCFRRIRTPPTSAPVPRAAPAPNISVCFQLFRIVVGDP
ncbi:phosphotransferase enzyme family protein [Burkholderia pseudomallei MSHR346]|nr:phosphotransferase enzyme family protein [Burkholderia pseudomallei MSHR346]